MHKRMRNGLRRAAVLALVPMACLLVQCDRVQSMMAPKTATATPYDFTVTLDMTPEAAARLKVADNDLMVTAFFYGQARPEYRAAADEMNRISLGYQADTYGGGARKIHIVARELDPLGLPRVVGARPSVLVTVLAVTKKGFEDKLPEHKIECRSFNGPIELAQGTPQTLNCDVWRP